ncbi:MAG: CheY-like chemotaxis protein, partial [bacterium]
MNNRLLLVESSATMRYVLDKHVQSLGFVVDATD